MKILALTLVIALFGGLAQAQGLRAPDGTYVDGFPMRAPDGSYVGGFPMRNPDGTYSGVPMPQSQPTYPGLSEPINPSPSIDSILRDLDSLLGDE